MYYIRIGAALIVSLATLACSTPAPDDALSSQPAPAPSTGDPSTLVSTDTATDPTVRRLEREAVALARPEGCATAAQCRSVGMGSRPCGGPRYYVPYCPLTTDTAALLAKVAEVARAEDEYNRRAGLVSTCEMRMPAPLELSGGTCRFRSLSR